MLGVCGVLEQKIPKNAVEPLIEHCNKLGEDAGISGADVFKKYLEWMKKHADYFFSEPWPEKRVSRFGFSDGEWDFVESGEDFEEKAERFTIACLRRNISMEGFDVEGFREGFKFYGGIKCWCCSIDKAAGLREQAGLIEKRRREMEQAKWEESSEVVKEHKMLLVELRLYEELGGAGGRSCRVKIKYACPYGEESEQLIEKGGPVETLWKHIEWYDCHWNPSHTYRPSDQEVKWYHCGEPSIIDVTSYDDVLKAREDGRLERIIQEHERYMKETGREVWAL